MPRLTSDITPENLAVGRVLRAARERAGVTATATAAALGITGATISQWESGQRQPRIEMIPRLAEIYGLKPWTLAKEIFAAIRQAIP